ncbi:hypothetical protein, partial [Streptomyces capoamus]|uniref:hypothetical protein n=1 Tax=Streptomyces capoamus TaxID=68183 RepID=UPI001E65DAF1
ETALDLVGRGLIEVRVADGARPGTTGPVLGGQEVQEVLSAQERWMTTTTSMGAVWLSAPEAVHARWQADAFPAPASGGFPPPGERTPVEETLLICTAEASGWLTGPYGVLESPEDGSGRDESLAWVEPQIAPLIQWVERGWIEVHYYPGRNGSFTVIPARELLTTLAAPAVWHEDGDWGEGVTCEFTDAGLGAWRSRALQSRRGNSPSP